MNIIEKVNRSRYTLKEILNDEWDVSTLPDLSEQEIEKIYSIPSSKNSNLSQFGIAAGCNFSLKHNFIPSYTLHVIYYNFPEVGRESSKVTKQATEKILNLYKTESININDSVFVIINDKISETLEKSFNDLNINLQNEYTLSDEVIDEMKKNKYLLEKRHFNNVFLFSINSLTNNLLKHRLVPKHNFIRKNSDINEILQKCNCTLNQLPVILKNDIISKFIRLTPGDICHIERNSQTSGEYPFYRVCK